VFAAALGAVVAFASPSYAHTVVYEAPLSGPAESPPNTSPGTGFARVTLDLDLATMEVAVTFSGLVGTTTASHIHCCTTVPGVSTAGVATQTPTFTLFPLGVTSGTYDHTFDLASASSYNPAFVTAQGGTVDGAMNALLVGLDAGKAYLNIHTSFRTGGEIRGFLHAVPEPETYALLLVGLGLMAIGARRRLY
jgi:hypothetical protein